jgi:diguanylate cyclase (GGDEF)-like protein
VSPSFTGKTRLRFGMYTSDVDPLHDDAFYYRLTVWPVLLTIAVAFPFGLYRLAIGDVGIGLTVYAVLLVQCSILLYLMRGGSVVAGAHVLAATYTGGVIAIMLMMGGLGSYWVFPAVVANFFILPVRTALAFNAIVLVSTVPLVMSEPMVGVRVAAGLGLVCMFSYVFARQIDLQRRALHRLALIDPLTGIGNRRALEAELRRIVDEQRYGIRASLVMLDLDDFKDINDLHGHAAGDEAICTLVQRIAERLREADRLYRYGGEEFVVICRHVGVQGAARLAESLRQLVAEIEHPQAGRVTASFGAAEWRKGESPGAWLARADAMMYRAKELGRNRVCYDAEADPATVDKVRYIAEAKATRLAGR